MTGCGWRKVGADIASEGGARASPFSCLLCNCNLQPKSVEVRTPFFFTFRWTQVPTADPALRPPRRIRPYFGFPAGFF
ncbi:hypothetical protein U1Q18_040379 [Sarracenia purpurea var. burkii]